MVNGFATTVFCSSIIVSVTCAKITINEKVQRAKAADYCIIRAFEFSKIRK